MALIGSAGIAAAWVAAAMLTSSQCGWRAVIAAVDAAWLLRLGRVPSGWTRMALGVAATLLAIALLQDAGVNRAMKVPGGDFKGHGELSAFVRSLRPAANKSQPFR